LGAFATWFRWKVGQVLRFGCSDSWLDHLVSLGFNSCARVLLLHSGGKNKGK
jgi:hypothetical protein